MWVVVMGCGPGAPIPVHVGGGAPPAVTVEVSGSDWLVLERRFQVRASRPIEADLACTSPVDPLEDHHLPFVGTAGELRLYGLLAETPYECALTVEGAVAWTGGSTTDPLPDDLPAGERSGDPELASADDGYVLFSHWKLGAGPLQVQRLVLIDGEGRIRWYLPLLEATTGGVAAQVLESGLVVAGGGQGASPALYTLSGEVVFQVPPAALELVGYHHEALLTPEGWLLTLQGVPNSDGSGGEWLGFRLEAVDPATGVMRWSFDSQPLVDAGVLPPPADDDEDPYHANAVAWVGDDPEGPSVWVSLRGHHRLMRIDRLTGEAGGFFGPDVGLELRDLDGSLLPEEAWFWGQHAPEFRGDEVLVYDNGASRPGRLEVSRVARYRRVDDHTAQLVWQWSEGGWFEPNFGSAVTMPDGHVFVGTGHCGDCGDPGDVAWMLEVDPDTDEVVWRYDFTDEQDSLYRAQPIPGCQVFANRRYCGEAR